MIRFAENLNKMITAGLGGALEAPRTEVAVGHRVRYLESSGAVASFESNIAAPLKKLIVNMNPIQAGSGDPSPDNIRPITGRDRVIVWRESTYDPGADPALTVQLGQTVYAGTAEIISGSGESTYGMVDLGTLNWAKNQTYPGLFNGVLPIYATKSSNRRHICSIFIATDSTSVITLNNSIAISGSGTVIYAHDNRYENADDFKAAMGGMQLCYKLEHPAPLILTPVNLSTIVGDNAVWSDAGYVSLEYPYYEETEGY